MRHIGLLLGGLVVAAVGIGVFVARTPSAGSRPSTVDGTVTTGRDADLAAAVLTAQRQLPEFIEAFKKGQGKFAVCGKFETPSGPEHLWVRVDKYEGEVFSGKLDVEPKAFREKRKGDPISVKQADVVDWMYDAGEGMKGGFTLKALKN